MRHLKPIIILALSVTALSLAAVVPAFAGATPASATIKRHEAAPTFYDCFKLAWVRGVHVERDELGAFNEYCLANQVPFDSGFPAGSVHRDSD